MVLNSAVVEVVIGMIFVFSLLSILVTQINTVIVNVLNLQAKHLRGGLETLLTDSVVRAKLLCHPLIGMVRHDVLPDEFLTPEQAEAIAGSELTRVNWIAPEKFVSVFKDVLTISHREDLYEDLYAAADALPLGAEKWQIRELIRGLEVSQGDLRELYRAIYKLPDSAEKNILMASLDRLETRMRHLQVENWELGLMVDGIRKVDDPGLQDALHTILGAARSLRDAEQRLESWFNNAMDQVSAGYTRQMQVFSLAIGLLLAVILNVDTLNLARALWNDPALRQAVVTAAEATAEQQAAVEATAQPADDLTTSTRQVEATLDELLGLRLPLGWEYATIDDAAIALSTQSDLLGDPRENSRNIWNLWPGNNSNWIALWLQKLAGWGITMIAIAQGAPFWFNLLNRLTGGNSNED